MKNFIIKIFNEVEFLIKMLKFFFPPFSLFLHFMPFNGIGKIQSISPLFQ